MEWGHFLHSELWDNFGKSGADVCIRPFVHK
jgi:hypothetical protein